MATATGWGLLTPPSKLILGNKLLIVTLSICIYFLLLINLHNQLKSDQHYPPVSDCRGLQQQEWNV